MGKLPPMVDMIRVPDEAEMKGCFGPDGPKPYYPYGLSICFDEKDLDRLELDDTNVEVGDLFHLFAICKVTSISKNSATSGETTRIEMQITHISAEDESAENEMMDDEGAEPVVQKLYK